jgi:subfamily B ATP-binding cassette protein MsbA
LSIARAILKDAPILILDEATSSLDSKAEHEVQTALDRLMKARTVLIIAHRLSTIAGVDTIVTLKKTVVSMKSVHQVLLRKQMVFMHSSSTFRWGQQNQPKRSLQPTKSLDKFLCT